MEKLIDKCAIHHLQKTQLCLNKLCPSSFQFICKLCSQQKHSQHRGKLIHRQDFSQKLENAKTIPIGKKTQVVLFDLHNKVNLLRNFRTYILEKENLLFLNNISIKESLNTIKHEDCLIKDYINNVKDCSLEFQKILSASRDWIEFNEQEKSIFVTNGKIKKHEQIMHNLIMSSLTYVSDFREYLVKIIQVLMDEPDEEEMENAKKIQKNNTIQEFLKQIIIQDEFILQRQIKDKLQTLYKINPIHPLCKQITHPHQNQSIECPQTQIKNVPKSSRNISVQINYQPIQHINNPSQILRDLQHILQCGEEQILQRIQAYFCQFSTILQEKQKIIKDNMNNVKKIGQLQEINNLLNVLNQQNNHIIKQLKMKITNLESKLQEVENIKNIKRQMILNQQISCETSDFQNIISTSKVQKDQNSLIKRKFNNHKSQSTNVENIIDNYKVEVNQKFSILKNTIKNKQYIISNQKYQIEKLSVEKNKSVQKSKTIQKQNLKNRIILRKKEEKIHQLSLVNKKLEIVCKKSQNAIKKLENQFKNSKQIIQKLKEQKYQTLIAIKKQQKQIYSFQQQMKIQRNFLTQKQENSFQQQTPNKNKKFVETNVGILKVIPLKCEENRQNNIQIFTMERMNEDINQINQSQTRLQKTCRTNQKNFLTKRLNRVITEECLTTTRILMNANKQVNALEQKILATEKIENAYKKQLQKKREQNKKLKVKLGLIQNIEHINPKINQQSAMK